MSRSSTINAIVETGIVPVIRASSPEQALAACNAVLRGGITTLEITMTVPRAIRVMEKLADSLDLKSTRLNSSN